MHHTAKLQKNPPPQEPSTRFCDFDDDSVPELGSSRPDRLADVRPQERVHRHTVETSAPLPLADARCSCATDGEPTGGVSEDRCRAGPRRAQDLTGPSWWNSWWMCPCQSWSSWHAARAHLNCCSGEELLVADGYAQHQEGPPADIHRQRRAAYKNSARS